MVRALPGPVYFSHHGALLIAGDATFLSASLCQPRARLKKVCCRGLDAAQRKGQTERGCLLSMRTNCSGLAS